MKISKKAFEAALDKASKVIKSKNTLPVLDNFLLNCENGLLKVTASDLETTLIVSTPAAGGEIKLTSKDVDFEKEYTNTLQAECTGEPVECMVYYNVFGKGIKSAGVDSVKLNYVDNTRVFVIQLESRLIGLMPAYLH